MLASIMSQHVLAPSEMGKGKKPQRMRGVCNVCADTEQKAPKAGKRSSFSCTPDYKEARKDYASAYREKLCSWVCESCTARRVEGCEHCGGGRNRGRQALHALPALLSAPRVPLPPFIGLLQGGLAPRPTESLEIH